MKGSRNSPSAATRQRRKPSHSASTPEKSSYFTSATAAAGVVDPRAGRSPGLEELRPLGVELRLERHGPLALAAETRHPRGHVGLEADPRLLAVVADVHPAFELPVHDVLHRRRDLAGEPDLVDRLLVVLADQQVGEHLPAGKAFPCGW